MEFPLHEEEEEEIKKERIHAVELDISKAYDRME